MRTGRSFTLLALLLIVLQSSAWPHGGEWSPGRASQRGGPDQSSAGLGAPANITDFDGERALGHVKRVVEIGPRPSGSVELEQTRNYIRDELKSYGLKITSDEFTAVTPSGRKRMVNITAEITGRSEKIVLLAGHYDTKNFREFRFVGANDGGSSTGALIELARVLARRKEKPRVTYRFVFFDGEEAVCKEWDECSKPGAPDHTYGSRRYTVELTRRGELKRVGAMILLDMIGYKNLQLGRDEMSTQWLVDLIWKTARARGYAAYFVDRAEAVGGDDHEPFLRAGVAAVDLIQLNSYPHWHRAEDTLDKLSARSLQIVGEVVLASLPPIEERLLSSSSAGAAQ